MSAPMVFGSVVDSINRSLKYVAPPTKLLPSEYAEKYLRISVDNAIPGPIRFDNVPYQREPLDMLVDPACEKITLMWAAQLGKTTLLNCGQAYFIDPDPQSMICMFPTKDDLEVWLETKFEPLIGSNDHIKKLLATPRAKGKKAIDNKKMKSYPGGFLMFAWAGSANTQRGRSAPKLFCDEVDGYHIGKEGNPVKLLGKRSATFGELMLLLQTSTPTLKDASLIETAYLEGDQRELWVKCCHCGAKQTLKFDQLKYKLDADGELVRHSVKYQCETVKCKKFISDSQKMAMVRVAKWIPKKKFRGHASYHLNELYSPFVKFYKIVQAYLDGVNDGDLQPFINTSLAQTYELIGELLNENTLKARAEAFKAEVPAGVLCLTMGVDVQHDRLEWEVVGWGKGCESWSIDYQVAWGDTSLSDTDEDSPWMAMDEYLHTIFSCEDGSSFKISTICVDSSDQTDRVYNYCRRRASRRVYAIKGVSGWGRPIVSPASKKSTKKTNQPVSLFPVGVDVCKKEVHQCFNVEDPGPRFCHVPNTRDLEWFEQLSAEQLIKAKNKKGYVIYSWKQLRARNEALDCRVYATAGLYLLAQDPLRFLSRRAKFHEAKWENPEKAPDEKKIKAVNIKPSKKQSSKPKSKKVIKWR